MEPLLPAYQWEAPVLPTVPVVPTTPAAPTVSAATRPAAPAAAIWSFELLLKVQQPSKQVHTAQRKLKNEKQDNISISPVDVNSDITWEQLLLTVSDMFQSKPANLAIANFEWHWLKPASGPWLPLQTSMGLLSILKQVVTCKTHPYVLLCMQSPKADAPALVSVPNLVKIQYLLFLALDSNCWQTCRSNSGNEY